MAIAGVVEDAVVLVMVVTAAVEVVVVAGIIVDVVVLKVVGVVIVVVMMAAMEVVVVACVIVDVVVLITTGAGSSPLNPTLMTTTMTIANVAIINNIARPIFTNLPHRIVIEHRGMSSLVPPPFPPRPSSAPPLPSTLSYWDWREHAA